MRMSSSSRVPGSRSPAPGHGTLRRAASRSAHHIVQVSRVRFMSSALRLCVAASLSFLFLAGDLMAQDALASRRALLERAGAEGLAEQVDIGSPGDREGFYRVLSSPLFLYESVGPFDLYVMIGDGITNSRNAKKMLGKAAKGLEKIVPVMARYFSGADGLISGRRLPIVLTQAMGEDTAYKELVALLDWAEGDDADDWSGWTWAGNKLWDTEVRRAVTARTWEAQIFNIGHPEAAGQGDAFFEHGLGYYTIAHIVSSTLNRGAWGLVPPFVAQGLIDELDIQAYGEAWVGGDWWVRQTAGWFRPGWSGFLPTGMRPPPVVTGPPADLAVSVSEGGDSWQHRKRSTNRHWTDLVADRESEAPASFSFMAEHESFLPRDRALARCFMHLMLKLAADEERADLFKLVDRVPHTPASGMPDPDPLPILFARALGGVSEVAAFEAQSLERVLQVIGREDIGREMARLGGGELLQMTDHRDQCQWLYEQQVNGEVRGQLWNLILSAEYYQQLHQWKLLGAAFDARIDAALAASKKYPKKSKDVQKVAAAFQGLSS